MTNKVQKIREEVERLFNHVKDSKFESDSGAFYYLEYLLSFIDSLQEEPVSEDLEEASRNYADNEECGDDMYFAIKAAFKAGAEWTERKNQKK